MLLHLQPALCGCLQMMIFGRSDFLLRNFYKTR